MSYLPRMSKTYKEPQLPAQDLIESALVPGQIQPASSLVSEKTSNPQSILKQYKYIPHPPPTLPGPSVADEANEIEIFREASRIRRESIKRQSESETLVIDSPTSESSKASAIEEKAEEEGQSKTVKSKKNIKGSKTSVKKKGLKVSEQKKKDNLSVHMCLLQPDFMKSLRNEKPTLNSNKWSQESLSKTDVKWENVGVNQKNIGSTKNSNTQTKDRNEKKEGKNIITNDRSVQCTIFGNVEKTYVIPPAINVLLNTLSFLLYELSKEEIINNNSSDATPEGKRLMIQAQTILGELCTYPTEKVFNFEVTYSDSKRIEKIMDELQRYTKSVYGGGDKKFDKTESLKNLFIQAKVKELELGILNDKLEEKDNLQIKDIEIRQNDLKNPEITIQNKRLECEQLLAEVEFSKIELKKFQKTLAEADWDIKVEQEKINKFKKSSVGKCKAETVGKKASLQRLSSETNTKVNKSKESSESVGKKKT